MNVPYFDISISLCRSKTLTEMALLLLEFGLEIKDSFVGVVIFVIMPFNQIL
jgi:hypothetical protein